MYHSQSVHRSAFNYNGVPPPGLIHPHQSYPIAAPVLPSMQTHSRSVIDEPFTQHQKRQPERIVRQDPVKEEKAIGGVSAHLDYEMDQMADYVAEMSQGMYDLYKSPICLADVDIVRSVQRSGLVSPTFRKFVLQILTSTRLPSSTILLGLHYLATRMSMLNQKSAAKASSGQLYRMLTIALLLGSKFLDDNTFQNRSWSEVTQLPVTELNILELQWLTAIDWNLHTDVNDPHGFVAWQSHWDNYKQERAIQAQKQRAALAPIETNVVRHQQQRSALSPGSYYLSHFNPITPSYQAERPQTHYQTPATYDHSYDQPAWYHSSSGQSSPPSAPETGPNTPEYFGLPSGWSYQQAPQAYGLGPSQSIRQMNQPQISQQPQHCSYQHSLYAQAYPQNPWSHGHGLGCWCSMCSRAYEQPQLMPSYGSQAVVG
ncbi:MAG: hypothetical protein M1824_005890 [Vezdaea acicularis]|nr:MAG: hypothetical protein M1824_005890 [Vezdaea acicularis]